VRATCEGVPSYMLNSIILRPSVKMILQYSKLATAPHDSVANIPAKGTWPRMAHDAHTQVKVETIDINPSNVPIRCHPRVT
jgi:hypothetical protein